MTESLHPVGSLVRYREGSEDWAKERAQDRPYQFFEVVALVQDGTPIERIQVRAVGAAMADRFAYDTARFEQVALNPQVPPPDNGCYGRQDQGAGDYPGIVPCRRNQQS